MNNFGWKPLRYHRVQSQLWQYGGRFAAVVAGRRSGKTEICQRKLVLQLPLKKEWPDPIYLYILPTFAQARKVAWDPILRKIPKEWIVPKNGINKTEMSITTVFGSKLYIVGADKPHRIEGIGADFVIIDESSDQRPGVYDRTIAPMLADRNGTCYRIGVPKRSGIGKLEFRDFFNRGTNGEDGIASFHWKSSEILFPEQLEYFRKQLDPIDYEEQFEAQWKDIGSSVYYNFGYSNVRDDESVQYNPACKIIVGCDFNVTPMAWVLAHQIDDKLYIFDEIFLRETNTQKTLDFLVQKYPYHLAGWTFYGDATSRARKTSAIRSDYLTIKNDARFGDKKVFFPQRNPHVRDRVASVNLAFKNASGDIRCYINSKCRNLINDLNSVSYVEGTTEIEDYSGTDVGHMSDALGYAIHGLMPIRLQQEAVPVIWSA